MKRLLVLLAAVTLLASGCTDDPKPTTDSVQSGPCKAEGKGTTDLATKPVAAYRDGAEPTETTVHDIVCGSGEEAKDGSKVEVKYVGLLFKDGKEFDSSWSRGNDETLPFKVGGGVIPGFSKAVSGMKVGGRREVIIPSKDAYGDQGSGPIPASATLDFIIDLVTIVPPPSATPCTPSGSGTTDLNKKPVVTVPTAPAPTKTTVTDIVCGTGAQADEGSAVEVKYVGVLYTNGKEFDSSWKTSDTNTLPFTVGSGVIPGFSTGVTGMKVGGRRMIVIPPADGYGATASGAIPGNSTLIFVIDLVKAG